MRKCQLTDHRRFLYLPPICFYLGWDSFEIYIRRWFIGVGFGSLFSYLLTKYLDKTLLERCLPKEFIIFKNIIKKITNMILIFERFCSSFLNSGSSEMSQSKDSSFANRYTTNDVLKINIVQRKHLPTDIQN